MAQLPTNRSIPALTEALFGVGSATLPVKGVFKAAVTVTTPSHTASAANISDVKSATGTVTGAALGDIVLLAAPTATLPANQLLVSAYVTATDTVTYVFANASNTSVTGAARTFNTIVLDVT